jgi:alkylhydroperoxidase family enzyme
VANIKLPEGHEPERTRMWQLAPPLAKAAGSFSKTMFDNGTLTVREQELARMRVAQINACPI